MSQQAIRAAIEGRLKTWADAKPLQVAWASQTFIPPQTDYLLFALLPAETLNEDLEGVHRHYAGIAQISIAVLLDNAPGDAEGLLIELDALFPCSTYISATGLDVLIEKPVSAWPAIPDESHYILPVSFRYRADVI